MVSCATDVHTQLAQTNVSGTSGELVKRIEALLRNKAAGEVGVYLWRLNEEGGVVLSGLEYRSMAGWIRLPASDGNGECAGPREYIFGFFVDSAAWIAANFNRKVIAKELLRGEIRDALDRFTGRDVGRWQGRH